MIVLDRYFFSSCKLLCFCDSIGKDTPENLWCKRMIAPLLIINFDGFVESRFENHLEWYYSRAGSSSLFGTSTSDGRTNGIHDFQILGQQSLTRRICVLTVGSTQCGCRQHARWQDKIIPPRGITDGIQIGKVRFIRIITKNEKGCRHSCRFLPFLLTKFKLRAVERKRKQFCDILPRLELILCGKFSIH